MLEIWTVIATILAAFGACATAWLVYHLDMLGYTFMASSKIVIQGGKPLLRVTLKRSKMGGPSGKFTRLKMLRPKGVLIASRQPRCNVVGAVSYGGDGRELWEEPIFSDSASCDAHFDSTDLELSIDFCITLSSTTMCHAVLIAEHNSWTLMAKKIDIHIKAIQHAATETALRTGK